jgi:hypothetical protein
MWWFYTMQDWYANAFFSYQNDIAKYAMLFILLTEAHP